MTPARVFTSRHLSRTLKVEEEALRILGAIILALEPGDCMRLGTTEIHRTATEDTLIRSSKVADKDLLSRILLDEN